LEPSQSDTLLRIWSKSGSPGEFGFNLKLPKVVLPLMFELSREEPLVSPMGKAKKDLRYAKSCPRAGRCTAWRIDIHRGNLSLYLPITPAHRSCQVVSDTLRFQFLQFDIVDMLLPLKIEPESNILNAFF